MVCIDRYANILINCYILNDKCNFVTVTVKLITFIL